MLSPFCKSSPFREMSEYCDCCYYDFDDRTIGGGSHIAVVAEQQLCECGCHHPIEELRADYAVIKGVTIDEHLMACGEIEIHGSLSIHNIFDMQDNKILNLGIGTNPDDAVNKSQLDLKANQTYVDGLIKEQETKINNAISIAEEARARTVALNMAISSIKDLSHMVKSLKNEVESLKTELGTVKKTNELLMKKRKWLTDEERETVIPKVIEIITNHYIYVSQTWGNPKKEKNEMYEGNKEEIDIITNVIVTHSKTEQECIRISNKIKHVLVRDRLKFHPDNVISCFNSSHIPMYYYRDYKIIYFAIYEVHRHKKSKEPNSTTISLLKSIEDGGQIWQ